MDETTYQALPTHVIERDYRQSHSIFSMGRTDDWSVGEAIECKQGIGSQVRNICAPQISAYDRSETAIHIR